MSHPQENADSAIHRPNLLIIGLRHQNLIHFTRRFNGRHSLNPFNPTQPFLSKQASPSEPPDASPLPNLHGFTI